MPLYSDIFHPNNKKAALLEFLSSVCSTTGIVGSILTIALFKQFHRNSQYWIMVVSSLILLTLGYKLIKAYLKIPIELSRDQ